MQDCGAVFYCGTNPAINPASTGPSVPVTRRQCLWRCGELALISLQAFGLDSPAFPASRFLPSHRARPDELPSSRRIVRAPERGARAWADGAQEARRDGAQRQDRRRQVRERRRAGTAAVVVEVDGAPLWLGRRGARARGGEEEEVWINDKIVSVGCGGGGSVAHHRPGRGHAGQRRPPLMREAPVPALNGSRGVKSSMARGIDRRLAAATGRPRPREVAAARVTRANAATAAAVARRLERPERRPPEGTPAAPRCGASSPATRITF